MDTRIVAIYCLCDNMLKLKFRHEFGLASP